MRTPLAAALLAAAPCSPVPCQQVVPETPAINREVTGVVRLYNVNNNPESFFTRPHAPAYRTTADGRLGIVVEHYPFLSLMQPEKMTAPFLLNPPGPATMSWYSGALLNPSDIVAQGSWPSHLCLWDPTPPYASQGRDVYDLIVFASANSTVNNVRQCEFFTTPMRVEVANPKTPNATIHSVTKTGPTTRSGVFPFVAWGFEPVICGDGRLLIIRMSSPLMPWTHPQTGAQQPGQGTDICYAYYTGGAVADASQWTNLIPITFAPFDTRINAQFGFALAPFRDPSGFLIPPGEDIGGSYPWMDRDAKNLFMECVNDKLHSNTTSGLQARYPTSLIAGVPNSQWGSEDGGLHQGVSMVGSWTHGKVVQIDNLNNDMDYAIGDGDVQGIGPFPQQRWVDLYATVYGSPPNVSKWLGYGRSTGLMPFFENDNANIIDSLENRFNYREHFRPITLRDVVWPLSNSKHTDELAFDDYVDPYAVIVADMTGLMTFPSWWSTSNGINVMDHHSGWNPTTKAFSGEVRLQNAATTIQQAVPPWGRVIGPGRLEPIANGGVHGKGFWLDPSIGVEFALADGTWYSDAIPDLYLGIFVDCRFDDDDMVRRLVTFPDGTSVRLYGRRQILLCDAAGLARARITVPPAITPPAHPLDDLLPRGGWAHLGFRILDGGHDVHVLLDGLPLGRWRDRSQTLLQLATGAVTVGKTDPGPADGFQGWIDDFKLLAHDVDPETAANHAGATMIGLPGAWSGVWRSKLADRFPQATHDELSLHLQHGGEATFAKYAPYRDYTQDHGAHRQNIPSGTTHLRASLHFPEGPLFHDVPRPDTRSNRFCLSCHHAAGLGGLDLQALAWTGGLAAKLDPRRQPMQPAATIHGNIPIGLVDGTGLPSNPVVTGPGGQLIDEWMMPGYTGPAVTQSLSVLDGITGRELALLGPGATIDPALLGTSYLTIRANLDSAQGAVTMTFDGGAPNLRPYAPYAVFGTPTNPLQGAVIAPGTHTVTAQPAGGATTVMMFTMAGTAPRTVAGYQADYRAGVPNEAWSYRWNSLAALGTAGADELLHWSPTANLYAARGLAFPDSGVGSPYVGLWANGGHPGRGTGQGQSTDRFAIASWRVQYTGYYKVANGQVVMANTLGNGGEVRVITQVGTTFTTHFSQTFASGATGIAIPTTAAIRLTRDALIHVCVGPNGNDSYDGFTLDYDIQFFEAPF